MQLRRFLAAGAAALGLAGTVMLAQGTSPGAPANLTYQVNGRDVYLNWINSPGAVSFYRLEAGGSPGTTFFTWDSSVLVDPSKLPQLLSTFATGGVGNGSYYVRVKGVNGAGESPASNEIVVPVTGACQAPGAPADFTAITRGTTVYMAWNPGNGGLPTSYVIHASYSPGGPVIAALGTGPAYLNVGGVPAGTYYVRVYASNACGTSPASNEIVVNAPSNSPARTPDAVSGKLPWFEIRGLVAQAASDAAGLINGLISCPQRPGFPWLNYPIPQPTAQEADIIERQKTQRNPYIDAIVARLRQFDTRFGYNAKPTRANVNAIIAGDEIAYHWGSDAPEGSPNVYLIDVLGGHCTFGRETPDFRPFFNEYGRWTAAGAF